jgi:hypothetical protein
MPSREPTRILRFIRIANLHIYLRRGALHAPNHTPNDGLHYQTNHNDDVQGVRRQSAIPCGPRGMVHDYVPFYFGPLSPMMLNLKTGRVPGYTEGQEPLIYLVTTVQEIVAAGVPFVFSDGHGIATFTEWFEDVVDLDKVDWSMVGQRYWTDEPEDPDRQRRKQAEFLVHRSLPWTLIQEIAVIDRAREQAVLALLDAEGATHRPVVRIRRDWYYH